MGPWSRWAKIKEPKYRMTKVFDLFMKNVAMKKWKDTIKVSYYHRSNFRDFFSLGKHHYLYKQGNLHSFCTNGIMTQ